MFDNDNLYQNYYELFTHTFRAEDETHKDSRSNGHGSGR